MVALGDLNEDGHLDLITPNTGATLAPAAGTTITVLFGEEGGTFGQRRDIEVPGSARGASPVGSSTPGGTIAVLLDAGDGTFAVKKEYAAGTSLGGAALGDFDNDGNLDIATANQLSDDSCSQCPTVAASARRSPTRSRSIPTPTPYRPLIVSEPVTVADSARTYTYDVDAIDPDDDPLTYSLTDSPEGITIAPDTGLVSWLPFSGEADLTVRVDDDRGGFDEQSFVIEVLDTRPGEIHGTKFNDLDGDGVWDQGHLLVSSFQTDSVRLDRTQCTSRDPRCASR